MLIYTVKFKVHSPYGGDVWLERYFANKMSAKVFSDQMELAGFEVHRHEHGMLLHYDCQPDDVERIKGILDCINNSCARKSNRKE